jgi:hypothetical protein
MSNIAHVTQSTLFAIIIPLHSVQLSHLDIICVGMRPVAYRGGGFTPSPQISEDIGAVLDRMSKKNQHLDFLLQFTVFSYGCNLLNKGFF